MDYLSPFKFLSLLFLLTIFNYRGTSASTFTFVNKCDYTVWPGILSSSGSAKLDSTGFELQQSASRKFQAPPGWSGRFWGRTKCKFDESGQGSCSTGDCGSNQVECNGAGAAPPATLAEFTIASGSDAPGSASQDFYDVSLVDGYNLPMIVEASGGSGACGTTGCVVDVNQKCPSELKAADGGACRSACEAFGTPEYCCSGAFGNPDTCKPSLYSQMFKSACPRSYSYAYDDATSTFTCSGADYTITFCPSGPSQDMDATASIGTGQDGTGSLGGKLTADGSWLAKIFSGSSAARRFCPDLVVIFLCGVAVLNLLRL